MESRKMVPTKPHFFKPFLPGSECQLSIPNAFFRHLKGQNCDKVVLRNANEKTWHVKIEGRTLQDGWKEVVSDLDLHFGDFLVFRHEGDMSFNVMVFDSRTCEREYTSTTQTIVCVKMENETLNREGMKDMNSKRIAIGVKQGASMKKGKVITNIQGKAKASLLKNPYFEVNVTSTSIIKSRMTIPVNFARQNCLNKVCCEILLVNLQGRSWTATVNYDSRRTYIGSGWSSFRSENNLNCGDSFIFDLISKGKKVPVFKMRGLRKFKKEPNPARKKLPSCDIKYPSSSIRNPYFIAPINMCSGKLYRLVIPTPFARNCGLLRKACKMFLEDEQGKFWPMSLRPSVDHGRDRLNIENGWWEFIKAKGLETGDHIILELTKNMEKPVIMKFHGILENTTDAEHSQR